METFIGVNEAIRYNSADSIIIGIEIGRFDSLRRNFSCQWVSNEV